LYGKSFKSNTIEEKVSLYMKEENLIDKLIKGEKVKCKACHSGYFIPFNTTADKAHSFYCSNPKCNFIVRIDPIIEVE
jgi:hypothetical protein